MRGHRRAKDRKQRSRCVARRPCGVRDGHLRLYVPMAKDTEKLIRQLSLISYLMAERRPVTALEIRRDVEGYSGMNEDAFARRFYADRAELDSLGIQLTVDKPADGVAEQENYSLRPGELPPARRSRSPTTSSRRCRPRCRCSTASSPTPSRCGSRSSRSPGAGRARSTRPTSARVALGITGVGRRPRALAAPGEDRDRDLPQQDDHVRLLHDGARRDRRAQGRPVPPALPGRAVLPRSATRTSAARCASSGCRGSAARSPTRPRPSTTSSARRTSTRARTPTAPSGSSATPVGTAEIRVSERIAWQVERHFGRFGEVEPADDGGDDVFRTEYANAAPARRAGCSRSASTRASRARRSSSPRSSERVALLVERHEPSRARAAAAVAPPRPPSEPARRRRQRPRARPAIRPERFARLVTLASILIEAGRAGRRAARPTTSASACRSPTPELREDVNVLNVVNFGGGSYVLYAEVARRRRDRGRPRALLRQLRAPGAAAAGRGQGARRRDRPDRRAPARGLADARRARRSSPRSARTRCEQGLQVAARRRRRLRRSRASSRAAIAGRRLLRLEYYKPNEDEFTERTVEPYALINGREGWYVPRSTRAQGRRAPLPPGPHQDAEVARRDVRAAARGRPGRRRRGLAADRRGRRPRASRACGSRPSAPAGRARSGPWREELADGAVVVELPFAGTDWLVREVLKEAGDAAVLEPEDAREAVRDARAERRLARQRAPDALGPRP